jgi:hypothetical protein
MNDDDDDVTAAAENNIVTKQLTQVPAVRSALHPRHLWIKVVTSIN